LLQSVTQEDMRAIGQGLVKQAKNGDMHAVKLLLSYTVGAPTQAIATDTTAADALEAANRLHTAEQIASLNLGFGRY
jgi:hypothetical protein